LPAQQADRQKARQIPRFAAKQRSNVSVALTLFDRRATFS
jgi:hypothetical protein